MNKVSTQVATLKLILYSFMKQTQQMDDQDEEYLRMFIESKARVVTFFSNVSKDAFLSVLEDKKLRQTVKKHQSVFSSQFLLCFGKVEDEENRKVLELFKLKNDCTLVQASINVESLFGATMANEKMSSVVKYMSSLLCFSVLMNFSNIGSQVIPDRDRRYLDSLDRKARSKYAHFLDIILTPEQHNVLMSDAKRLCIMGEPGVGKTSVLLAKACSAALDARFEAIYFCVPESKTEIRDFLSSFANSQKVRHLLKEKFHVYSMEEFSELSHQSQEMDVPK